MVAVFPLAGILALVHFFSESYGKHQEKYHIHLISFSSGLFLSIILLQLLPEFFKGIVHIGENIFILLLAGFVLFHVSEKYVYQHIKNKNEMLQDLALLHAVGFFVNHFLVGIALFLVFQIESTVSGFLLFIPLLLHTFSSSLSLNHLDSHFRRKSFFGLVLPLAPVFGVTFATLLKPNLFVYHMLFSFVLGAMLYVAIRDMMPSGEKGKPLLFLSGVFVSVVAVELLSLF
jgi:zinc transporter ZupT